MDTVCASVSGTAIWSKPRLFGMTAAGFVAGCQTAMFDGSAASPGLVPAGDDGRRF